MSDDSDDGADNADQQAALNNIVQPLRKLIKKQSSKIDKLSKVVSTLEEERAKEAALREEMERQLSELKATGTTLKATLDQNPWRYQNEQTEATVRALEKRLTDSLDEQRVQLTAHTQVFQSTQSTVSQLSQSQASLQAEQNDGGRRAAEELRSLTARIDHMRGEMSERLTHTFSESTQHADRLSQRLQEDVHRLDQEISNRAQTKNVSESTASLQSELQ